MTRLAQAKLGLAAAALAVFAWGARSQDERFTWAAMALLGLAFLLRFAGPRPQR